MHRGCVQKSRSSEENNERTPFWIPSRFISCFLYCYCETIHKCKRRFLHSYLTSAENICTVFKISISVIDAGSQGVVDIEWLPCSREK